MWTIVRFNWPFYCSAIALILASTIGFVLVDSLILKIAVSAMLAGAVYFLIGSLVVSHWVYDRSDLYRWNWLKRAEGGVEVRKVIFCHTGFDEASLEIRNHHPGAEWVVLDHYDETLMSEASIRRARKLFPPASGTRQAAHDRWPAGETGADLIFGLLAIHELRSEKQRGAWFAQAKLNLKPGGRVIIVEHTRNFANGLAFGPGVLHFHSRSSWRRSWERAGLNPVDEFTLTPWLRVFVLSI
jgi:hypothetical protein